MKRLFLFSLLAFSFVFIQAQHESEAAFIRTGLSHNGNLAVGDEATLQISVVPKKGWHVYSAAESEDGAYQPATLDIQITSTGFELTGGMDEVGSMHSEYDDIMGGMLRYYEEKVVFTHNIKITEQDVVVAGDFEYMACNDFKCIPLLAEIKMTAKAAE